MKGPDVSVVIPVYCSQDCLSELVARLAEAFRQNGRSYEVVLVNDCSPDQSWDKIVELAEGNDCLRGVNLRRNSGQDNALMAGLRHARGQVVAIMDDDLQHDPADLGRLIEEVEKGYDVCYARFPKKRQAWWKNLGSWLNDKVANAALGKPKHLYLSPYKAILGEVVRELICYTGPYPYVDGLIFRVTRNVTQVDVEHHHRYSGGGNYNLVRSVSVWLKLVTNFTLAPLRLATCLGLGFSVFGLILALVFTVRKLMGVAVPIGWSATIVTVLVMGGIQLASLGVIGEYLGRVFLHLNQRPQYVVKSTTPDKP